MADSLAPGAVLHRLRGRFGRPYVYVERCPSTQRLLEPSAPEGALAVAEEQTEGRGRLGRRWVSPPGAGVLCSLMLRPPVEPARWPELSLLAGQACAEAIGALARVEATVKTPNDVLIRGRKVAGILGEASESRVVLGIGVNANLPESAVPAELRGTATSLLIETRQPVDRAELLVTLLERLEQRYDDWLQT